MIVNPMGRDPINGSFSPEVYHEFPFMLRRLAVMYACISFAGSLLISEPIRLSALISEEYDNENDKDREKKGVVTEVLSVSGVGVTEALNTSQFWLMWAMIITSASAGLNVVSMYKQFASISPVLKGDSYQALVGGMGALFNGFGRLFWGKISDRIGFKTSFTILTIAQALVQFLYPYSISSKVCDQYLQH
jgi:hypothetical protein